MTEKTIGKLSLVELLDELVAQAQAAQAGTPAAHRQVAKVRAELVARMLALHGEISEAKTLAEEQAQTIRDLDVKVDAMKRAALLLAGVLEPGEAIDPRHLSHRWTPVLQDDGSLRDRCSICGAWRES